jgi:hypothetical protein
MLAENTETKLKMVRPELADPGIHWHFVPNPSQ